MAEIETDEEIRTKIQDTYVPFLKKLIAFLEKTKKATPDNVNKLKSIYAIFTSAPIAEQVETFIANRKKLEKWYQNAQKEKQSGESTQKGKKTSETLSDTDSSQGPTEISSTSGTVKESKSASSMSISSVRSVNFNQSAMNNITAAVTQIKKEKVDNINAQKQFQPIAPAKNVPAPVSMQNSGNQAAASNSSSDVIVFTCASCQFSSTDEAEFMKHARTDHRSDLSMWCKQCGKCFSNAGVLVSHIKERNCVKENMIYRCGVKDCTFETTSGQTFVHHLRHCHKGSPFIFCYHCQKIFTLPHCLILHMQDDCPFKDRNRLPADGTAATEADSTTTAHPKPAAPPVAVTRPPALPTIAPKPVVSTPIRPPIPIVVPVPSTSSSRGRSITPRGRGRGRGRGRARPPSESSDSDDPDDPSWRPEESLGATPLRRSGRWAKKINDVINVEPSLTGQVQPASKKSLSLSELNSKEMLNCPCCEFMAAFQSVLEDHYIANHKVPSKNACLECHLKFENTKLFLEHFVDHTEGKLNNLQIPETSNNDKSEKMKTSTVSQNTISTQESNLNDESDVSLDDRIFDDVVKSISEANVVDPITDKYKFAKIPYQAAIHDKNLKDSKLKKFEELKSPSDLVTMRDKEKLKHFYKCISYNCTYTTDDTAEFCKHIDATHGGKKFNCGYCLAEAFAGDTLTNHMLTEHGKRHYQCSDCFYRAYSKIHVQIHIKNYHAKDADTEVFTCKAIAIPSNLKPAEIDEPTNTTWPYICAIGECQFQTFDPKEFKKHNETIHRTVSMFYCHYCKVDFISFKKLWNHYRLHGLNTFQCNYCIHGSETRDEILLHLCNTHADQPLKAFMRGTSEDASLEAMALKVSVKNDNIVVDNTENEKKVPDKPEVSINAEHENELFHVVDGKCYPKSLQNICSDLFCGIPCCEEKFENVLSYVGHLRNIHAAVNFPCPHCPEVLDVWGDFKSHLICHGPELYACSFEDCDFYHWDKNEVGNHMENHGSADSESILIRTSANESDVSSIESLPRECPFKIGDEKYECLFCRYKSSNRNIMKNHLYSEMAYNRFCCSYCSKRCLSRSETKSHFISHHPDYEIKCSIHTNSEVENAVQILLDEKISFPEIKSNASCIACLKKFHSILLWQNHLYICLHKEYRPYGCSYCKNGFSSLKALKYHFDKNHTSDSLQFLVIANYAIEEEISKKLLQVRFKYLNEFVQEKISGKEKNDLTHKFYACSLCSYLADFKYNVEKHIKDIHEDINATVTRLTHENLENSNVQTDENSNDSVKLASDSSSANGKVKRYRCGFCIKKLYTFQEFESHVRSSHPTEPEYFYYYSPDAKIEYLPNDKEMYECAYCKSGKENLSTLKKHSDLMHSEMQFKVKGYASHNQLPVSYLACGHCYLKLENYKDLRQHSSSHHPSLPMKSFGDFKETSSKRVRFDTEESGDKRVKFEDDVFICAHCGGAFSSLEQITCHRKRTHPRLQLEYKQMETADMDDDVKFYKCEFCAFIGEKYYLDKHLAAKHKMRVSCFYCKKRFEFATKLKLHHDTHHKNLPVKYCQETISTTDMKAENEISDDFMPTDAEDTTLKATIPEEGVSHYGTEPEPVDLESVTVVCDDEEGHFTTIPLSHFAQMYNIFPQIILQDVKKE